MLAEATPKTIHDWQYVMVEVEMVYRGRRQYLAKPQIRTVSEFTAVLFFIEI